MIPSAFADFMLTTSSNFVGNGANIVYIDWDNDLVIVVRWIKDEAALNEFLGRVIGAMGAGK